MQRFFFLGCCYKCLVEHKGRNVFIPVTALKKKVFNRCPNTQAFFQTNHQTDNPSMMPLSRGLKGEANEHRGCTDPSRREEWDIQSN